MNAAPLDPLQTLYVADQGSELPLPADLVSAYGQLRFPAHHDRSTIIANFVTTLDGVIALDNSGQGGGSEISGNNQQDRMVMGLLRAIADAVIVGAGTQRAVPRHRWTAEYIYPPLAGAYQQLRTSLGKSEPPLNVIVTARGNVILDLPLFQSGKVPVLIVTTTRGAENIGKQTVPSHVRVQAIAGDQRLSARGILEAVRQVRQGDMILVEGGGQLLGDFLAERSLNELFLTLAPQIVGRDDTARRPGLVMGRLFAPEHPLWGTLISVKRGENHLFLRYSFTAP